MNDRSAHHTPHVVVGLGHIRLPLRLASEIATLDQISHGRVEFGTGIGVHEHEFIRWGMNYYERAAISEEVLQLNQGTICVSLLRLQQRRWITGSWGTSENNRRAKYYAITRAGRKQLARETRQWEQTTTVIARLFAPREEVQ